ncbi:MAG: flavodoxin family protein [Dehalococcoidia bacterium]|nr:flavodoxin family protein [Dehalococcoidia bacterium]
MKIKVLGINGSARRRGNTSIMINEALQGASELKDVETEYIALAEHKILGGCLACYICHKEPSLEKLCRGYKEPDDVNMIVRKMLEAEAWIIGTPVYFGGMTAQLKALIDRTHPVQPCGRAFRNKVCGVVTMAVERAGGAEATMDDIRHWLGNMDAIYIGSGPARPTPACGSFWGAQGVQGWPNYIPTTKPEARSAVKQDIIGMQAARNLGRRVVDLAKAVKAGYASLGEGETYWGYGPVIEIHGGKYDKYQEK